MELRILGPLEVVADGRSLPLGGPRQRAVLARLVLDAGRVVPADALIEDVWAGQPPRTAAKTLQKYVSELRKALPAPSILRTLGSGYTVELDPNAVDARRFERLVADGSKAIAAGEAAGGVRDLTAALALWRGDVLDDLGDCPFVVPERARLDELRLVAIEERLAGALVLGRHAEAAGELAELVEAHPLRERLWASLMLALYRAGRQVEALRAFERHRRQLIEEIGVEPSSELRQLEAAVLRQDPSLAATSPASTSPTASPPPPNIVGPGNLRLPLSSFVGRDAELAWIDGALRDHRLVTLTGPGGVGKTRLAWEVAHRARGRFDGGAWTVELAGVRDPALVAGAAATALGVEAPSDEPVDASVAEVLCHRGHALVVLDNCEHLVEACARFATGLLLACPMVRVLATSRRPLGVDGECVRPVPPLGLPDEDVPTEAQATDAVRLFVDRARLARPDFDLGPDVVAPVGQVCRQLDGLPLAIELAATQVRVLEPAEIVARLHDRFRFLARPSHPEPRQRTLQEAIGWSYDLLRPATRRVFDRLGVFAGSLTLEAAEAVCADEGVASRDVLGHVTVLGGGVDGAGGGGLSRTAARPRRRRPLRGRAGVGPGGRRRPWGQPGRGPAGGRLGGGGGPPLPSHRRHPRARLRPARPRCRAREPGRVRAGRAGAHRSPRAVPPLGGPDVDDPGPERARHGRCEPRAASAGDRPARRGAGRVATAPQPAGRGDGAAAAGGRHPPGRRRRPGRGALPAGAGVLPRGRRRHGGRPRADDAGRPGPPAGRRHQRAGAVRAGADRPARRRRPEVHRVDVQEPRSPGGTAGGVGGGGPAVRPGARAAPRAR